MPRPFAPAPRRRTRIALAFALALSPVVPLRAQDGSPVVPEPVTEAVDTAVRGGDATAFPATYRQPASQGNGQEPADALRELEQALQRPAVVSGPPALAQEVTTVSRQESTVGKSPAAVFVITNDMLRRSGATTIAEALRMVPGMDVARIDNANWAIGSRGFPDRFARHLLVQIDGRTVYNPLFSGVFWQAQDLLLQDVERIEVVRGPGATVWGANAVNGVINIITKSAQDTQGALVTAGGGSEERGFGGVRYGGQVGRDAQYRVWGKWREVDHGFSPLGESHEDWRAGRGGFRMDWKASCCDTVTFQGDLFGNEEGLLDRRPITTPPFRNDRIEDRLFSGGDVLGRWTHEIDDESNWALQLYYNNFKLEQLRFDKTEHNTFDVDFQHQFPLGSWQQIIWGLGYRTDRVFLGSGPDPNGFEVRSFPPQRDVNLPSAFVQDQLTLVEDLWYFTAGCKFEDNEFTGFEYQPTARLLWTPSEEQSVWAAVSRAVRTPNFGEHHSRSTLIPALGGNVLPVVLPSPSLDSESMLAYELGYRAQPTDALSWDLALFYNDYRGLRALVPSTLLPEFDAGLPPLFYFPLEWQNRMDGETYGVELAANYQLNECWRLYGAYTFLQMQLYAPTAPSAELAEDQSPQNQVYLWLSGDLGRNWQLDLIGRYVDHLSGFAAGTADVPVPSYIEMDVRLGWKPRQHLELAVVGQNLLDSQHLEFGTNQTVGRPVVEVQRGVYGMVTATW
jgi:iron complex outermembrane receptor protein